jgi:hypothetical protein
MGDVERFEGFGSLPQLEPVAAPERTQTALQEAVDLGRLRFGFIRWPLHREPEMNIERRDGCFAVTGYQGVDRNTLSAAVRSAIERQVHVLVGPELALSESDLGLVTALMRHEGSRYPVLSVWGMTHRPRETGFLNEAVLLDSRGSVFARHEKLEAFTHPKLGLEDIVPRQSKTYSFIDTPIGRLVLNVCRDFRSDVPMLLNRALGATLIVVPAYSRELSFVEEEARILGARQAALTASTNAAAPSLVDGAYLYAPIRGRDASGRHACSVRVPAVSDVGQALLVVELCHNPSSLTVVRPLSETS